MLSAVSATAPLFSLNCQIAIQKYIDYYPAFEVAGECKFLKASIDGACSMVRRAKVHFHHLNLYQSQKSEILPCSTVRFPLMI